MCRFTSRTLFTIKPGMARRLSPAVSALRLAGGWIAILTGGTATSFSGDTITHVRLIGGMSRHISGTLIKRLSGVLTTIQARQECIMATGAMVLLITNP